MPSNVSRPSLQENSIFYDFPPFRSMSTSREQVRDPQPSLSLDVNEEPPKYIHSSSFSSDEDKKHVNLVWKNVKSWYMRLSHYQKRRLVEMGFDGVLSVDSFTLDPVLLNYVIARFRRETNSFCFDFGEMIISLEDVVRITGLRVQGLPVTTWGTFEGNQDLSKEILGQDYVEYYSKGEISLSWLSDTFSQGIPLSHRDGESWEEYLDRTRQHKARGVSMDSGERADRELRAFLLYLFGYVLFPNITTASVSDVWLQLLVDLNKVREYAWGAAVAAHLFSRLGSRLGDTNTVVGFLPLLQVWIWEHFDFKRPRLREYAKNIFPRFRCLSKRFWADGDRDGVDLAQNSKILLDENHVIWQPYDNGVDDKLPFIKEAAPFFCRDVWLHCFGIVECHYASRALRQFGLHQGIPADLPRQSSWEKLRNWLDHGSVVDEAPHNISLDDYMTWYEPILDSSGGACHLKAIDSSKDSGFFNTSESESMEPYDELKSWLDPTFSRMVDLECTNFKLQRFLDQAQNEAFGMLNLLSESKSMVESLQSRLEKCVVCSSMITMEDEPLCLGNIAGTDLPIKEMKCWMELIVERRLRSLEVKMTRREARDEGSRKVAGLENTIATLQAKIDRLEAMRGTNTHIPSPYDEVDEVKPSGELKTSKSF